MKTLLLQSIFCLLFSYVLTAFPIHDYAAIGADTIKKENIESDTIKKNSFKIIINKDDDDDDCVSNGLRVGMLDLGISTYVDNNRSLDLPTELDFMDQVLWRSINVGLHVVNVRAALTSEDRPHNLGISTGLKINWTHYSLEKDYNLLRNAPDYASAIDNDVPELRKNRLRGTYLQIPFLLEYNSNPSSSNQAIKLGIGYVHQILLGSQYKYKTEDEKIVRKTRGDFNLRKSMGMVEGRVGVGFLNFYVQYGLSTLFQDNNGPELTPINFGVNIIPR